MVTKQIYGTRAEWLAARTSHFVVGSSTIGTIMGLNPYCTPLQLWREWQEGKTEEGDQLMRGQYAEDFIARWFEAVTGNKIIKRSAEISVFCNDKYPDYMQCAPDRECFANGRTDRPIVECKDTTMFVDMDDLQTIPQQWYAQIQWQMGIMERSQAYVAINNGDKKLQYRLFTFDAAYFAKMVELAKYYVETYIIGGACPPVETGDDVISLYPCQKPDKLAEATETTKEYIAEYRLKRKALKILSDECDALAEKIKSEFTDNSGLTDGGVQTVTWREQVRKTFDLAAYLADNPTADVSNYFKETKYRQLKVK